MDAAQQAQMQQAAAEQRPVPPAADQVPVQPPAAAQVPAQPPAAEPVPAQQVAAEQVPAQEAVAEQGQVQAQPVAAAQAQAPVAAVPPAPPVAAQPNAQNPPQPPLNIAELRHWTSWEDFDAANYLDRRFYQNIPMTQAYRDQAKIRLFNKFRRVQGADLSFIFRNMFECRYAPSYLAIIKAIRYILDQVNVNRWDGWDIRVRNYYPPIQIHGGLVRVVTFGRKRRVRQIIPSNGQMDEQLAKEIEWVENVNRRQAALTDVAYRVPDLSQPP